MNKKPPPQKTEMAVLDARLSHADGRLDRLEGKTLSEFDVLRIMLQFLIPLLTVYAFAQNYL